MILYPSESPPSAAMLGLRAEDGGYPFIVISDGHVLEDNLRRSGRDMVWLREQLALRGVKNARQVFLLSVNAAGQIYYCAREKKT